MFERPRRKDSTFKACDTTAAAGAGWDLCVGRRSLDGAGGAPEDRPAVSVAAPCCSSCYVLT